jgi:hypothetical protein
MKANLVVRSLIRVFGLGAVAWGVLLLPSFWQQAPLTEVTAQILRGGTYDTQWLLAKARQVETAEQPASCNPTALHDATILRLAVLDQEIEAGDQTGIVSARTPVYDSARTALTCSPADPLAWLILFWLDAGQNGLRPTNANYLRLSYALGPNEAWIALWRSKLAFLIFTQLPADISDDAINEFIGLIDTFQLHREAAEIFAKASSVAQRSILAQLKAAKPNPRQAFARLLYDRGLDVNIPGVDVPHPDERRLDFKLPGVSNPEPSAPQ